MEKILISIGEKTASKMRAYFPEKKRSQIIQDLIEKEIEKREEELYQAALALESNEEHRKEVKEWDQAFGMDGLEDEAW